METTKLQLCVHMNGIDLVLYIYWIDTISSEYIQYQLYTKCFSKPQVLPV